MNKSWKHNNLILKEAAGNFPLKVTCLASYTGPDTFKEIEGNFFSVGERIVHSGEVFTKKVKNYSYGNNSSEILLAGYSDGEKFHVLAYDGLISVSFACYKYYLQTYNKRIDIVADDSEDFKNFLRMKKNLTDQNAKWTICWEQDISQYEEHMNDPFETKAKSLYGWRDKDRNEFKLFPTFVWEVTSIPLSEVTFERRFQNRSMQEFIRKI